MNKDEIINNIKQLNKTLESDGFIIDGLFGSYARGDYTKDSDVDLLYHLDKTFLNKYSGFIGFKKLDEIKKYLEKYLQKKVDLAPKNNLTKVGEKYILKDVIYV